MSFLAYERTLVDAGTLESFVRMVTSEPDESLQTIELFTNVTLASVRKSKCRWYGIPLYHLDLYTNEDEFDHFEDQIKICFPKRKMVSVVDV